jgi:hypothetical protein|tara:strand:+ start:47 stop:265 length:219 start_codon:yes stop_codon:yes gene_type:complete
MKDIIILILEKDCRNIKAQALSFECGVIEFNEEIEYPVTFNKEEIANIILPNANVDFSVKIQWIGGRPNDRR